MKIADTVVAAMVVSGLGVVVLFGQESAQVISLRPAVSIPLMHEAPNDAIVGIALARTLPSVLPEDSRAALGRIVQALKRDELELANQEWKEVVAEISAKDMPVDPTALIQWILREAYLEQNTALSPYVEKVRLDNDQKEAGKSRAQPLQKSSTIQRKSSEPTSVIMSERETTASQERELVVQRSRVLEADREMQLQTVRDDAQLANIDLQNELQRHQQTVQLMSNVSKMLHDTAMAIVRRVG